MNPLSPVLFVTWYTYAPAGGATDASGQRWFTAQAAYVPGTRTVNLGLYQTTGGVFDAVSNPAPTTASVGSATVTFSSCTVATLHFNFTAGSSAGNSGTSRCNVSDRCLLGARSDRCIAKSMNPPAAELLLFGVGPGALCTKRYASSSLNLSPDSVDGFEAE